MCEGSRSSGVASRPPDTQEAKASDPPVGPSSGGKKKKKHKGTAELIAVVEPKACKPRSVTCPAEKKDEGRTAKFCPIHNSRLHDHRECYTVKFLTEQKKLERASGSSG